MSDSHSHEASAQSQRPAEQPAPLDPKPELPSIRYRATLRLIGSRQVDEARSTTKRRRPWKHW